MSKKPNPVALTAAMLTMRAATRRSAPVMDRMPCAGMCHPHVSDHSAVHACASLASSLHRLARGAAKASQAECNGEMWPGQRAWAGRNGEYIAAEIEKYANRIDRAISKLNADLAPLAIEARRNGDPRGFAIKLRSTDPTRPLPSNEQGGEWGCG